MIFSTDLCPLCKRKLHLEIVEASAKVGFRYFCETREMVRNDANTITMAKYHYDNHCFQGGQLAEMLFPPFSLYHSQAHGTTTVYIEEKYQPKKMLFRTPLLDADYTQPHVVLNRLKLLVTFS